jgi:hypothetical protein
MPEQTDELPAISRGQFFDRLDAMKLVNGALRIETAGDAYRMARLVMGSELANPKWTEKEIFLILLNGQELGLSVNQALRNSYIVNNKVNIYGAAPKALVEASGLLEDFKQYEEGVYPEDNFTAVVVSKRRGRDPITTKYSVADAKEAGLWDKSAIDKNGVERAPWQTNRRRMLHWRALQFNLTDNFPDVLQGTFNIEEPPENEPGFERAKPATGRVVEPNFAGRVVESNFDGAEREVTPAPAPSVPPMTAPPKRRGRPPGSRNQPSLSFSEPAKTPATAATEPAANQEPAKMTRASDLSPGADPGISEEIATPPAAATPPAEPAKQTPPPAEQVTDYRTAAQITSAAATPPAAAVKQEPTAPQESEPLRLVKEWLASEGIKPAELVALLYENEYASADQELHEIDVDILKQVLLQKEKVKNLVEKNRVP